MSSVLSASTSDLERPLFASWRIDRAGILLDGWLSPEAVRMTHVDPGDLDAWVGRSIWDGIGDPTLRSLQQRLVERLFETGEAIQLPMHCDAPDHSVRLSFEATVSVDDPDAVRFSTRLEGSVSRPPIRLLGAHDEDGGLLHSCAWCARLSLPGVGWIEIEHALARFPGLDESPLPRLTHGLCGPCESRLIGEVAALGTSR